MDYYARLYNVRLKCDLVKYRIEIVRDVPEQKDYQQRKYGPISKPSVVVYERETEELLYCAHTSRTDIKDIIRHLLINYKEEE